MGDVQVEDIFVVLGHAQSGYQVQNVLILCASQNISLALLMVYITQQEDIASNSIQQE